MAAGHGNERWGMPDKPIGRRGVLKAGLAIGAVAGTGAWTVKGPSTIPPAASVTG